MRHRLPTLSNSRLVVASPCGEGWSDMARRPEGRFCDRCDRTVVDLSRMTAEEAEHAFAASNGRLCARVYADEDGKTYFRAQPTISQRMGAALTAALVALAAAPAASAEDTIECLDKGGPDVRGPRTPEPVHTAEPATAPCDPAVTPETPRPRPRARRHHPRGLVLGELAYERP